MIGATGVKLGFKIGTKKARSWNTHVKKVAIRIHGPNNWAGKVAVGQDDTALNPWLAAFNRCYHPEVIPFCSGEQRRMHQEPATPFSIGKSFEGAIHDIAAELMRNAARFRNTFIRLGRAGRGRKAIRNQCTTVLCPELTETDESACAFVARLAVLDWCGDLFAMPWAIKTAARELNGVVEVRQW